jgi:hypothetical protein
LWPAIFFLLFGLITAPVLDVFEGMKAMENQVNEAGPFIAKMAATVAGLSLAGIFFIIGMFLGVLKLTAFTRAFLSCPLPTSAAAIKSAEYPAQVSIYQAEAVDAMSSHKAYLAKAWALAALVMVPMLIVVFICGCVYMALIAPPAPQFPIPAETRSLAVYFQGAMIAAMVLINNYSVITLAVTSMTNRTIGEATTKSLLLTLTSAPLMTLVCIFVVVLSTTVTTPHEVVRLLHPTGHLTPGPLPIAMAWEVWQVLSGVMMYPICTALLTEVVRDSISHVHPAGIMPHANAEAAGKPEAAAQTDIQASAPSDAIEIKNLPDENSPIS